MGCARLAWTEKRKLTSAEDLGQNGYGELESIQEHFSPVLLPTSALSAGGIECHLMSHAVLPLFWHACEVMQLHGAAASF